MLLLLEYFIHLLVYFVLRLLVYFMPLLLVYFVLLLLVFRAAKINKFIDMSIFFSHFKEKAYFCKNI